MTEGWRRDLIDTETKEGGVVKPPKQLIDGISEGVAEIRSSASSSSSPQFQSQNLEEKIEDFEER